MDPLARLASSLNRPPASLSAFTALDAAHLQVLSEAIEATCERRQREIDAELARALPGAFPRALVVGLLRGPGLAAVRRAVIGRQR
jgi:hypothetical protein